MLLTIVNYKNELNEIMCDQIDDTSSQLMRKYVSKKMTLRAEFWTEKNKKMVAGNGYT